MNLFNQLTEIAYRGIIPDEQLNKMLNIKSEIEMADTKTECKQSQDEDNRKNFLENHSAYELVEMIAHSRKENIQNEFRGLVLDFVIENNIDLETY